MSLTPAKRARRTLSPSLSNRSTSPRTDRNETASRANVATSPSRPILPPPLPSSRGPSGSGPGTSFPLPPPAGVDSRPRSRGERPQSWAPGWGPSPPYSERLNTAASAGSSNIAGPSRSRHSIEPTSPSSPGGSPKIERGDVEGQEAESASQVAFSRDVTSRAPRSMMACTRCRRQKMKCDGPSSVPCRGCRQSGQPCIFEARSRPKSISSLPSRPPPFFSARPVTPTSALTTSNVTSSGFYTVAGQPPPTSMGRAPHGSVEYVRLRDPRDPREPMAPPPPAASINVLTSPYPPLPRAASPSRAGATTVAALSHTYHPHPTSLAPPYPIATTSAPLRPGTPTQEVRLRNVETAVRNLTNIPSTLSAVQSSLASLQRGFETLTSAVTPESSSRGVTEVPETVWEDYRSRAWPLTPWLVGLRETKGLPGLIVDYIGKKASMGGSKTARLACDDAGRVVRAEIGKLISRNSDLTREEVRALGVFGTWMDDPTLTSMAIAQSRILGLDQIWSPRKSHDDWREWIYLVIMDHLSQLANCVNPSISDVLASSWRDRLGASTGPIPPSEAAIRDRDLKLLAWLEYAETLEEVHLAHRTLRRSIDQRDTSLNNERGIVEAMIDIWRRYGSRWEAWAGAWSVRSDPILSLFFNYAILYTTSLGHLCRDSLWVEMSRDAEGYAVLERARDAAFAVVQAICSPEIGRTLTYSFPLFRPILALGLHLLLVLTTLSPNSSPLISSPHVLSVMRMSLETLQTASPPEMTLGSGLLGACIERGDVSLAAGLLDVELGRNAWRRIVG